MLDKEKIKQALTDSDITSILLRLGSSHPIQDSKGHLAFKTICHGGNKQKLYYYPSSKSFHCYTGCSCSFDIFDLVIRVHATKGHTMNFYESLQYVATLSGKWFFNTNNAQIDNEFIDDWNWIPKTNNAKTTEIVLPNHSKTVFDVFLKEPHELWLNDGISAETMDYFNIGYYVKDDRIVIPHFDIDGNLIGIRGRALRQEDIDDGKKYMPLLVGKRLYNHPTSLNLYGIHRTKDAIKNKQQVILFESEKSVLKAQDYYGLGNTAVAICGSSVSEHQIKILLSLDVVRVYIAFDKEYTSGKDELSLIKRNKYVDKLSRIAHLFQTRADVYILWDNNDILEQKDSPADKGKDILEQMIKNATPLQKFIESKDEIVINDKPTCEDVNFYGDYNFD